MSADNLKPPLWQKILFFVFIGFFAYISIFGFINRNAPFMMLSLAIVAVVIILTIRFDYLVPLMILFSAGVPTNVKGMMLSFGGFSLYTAELILYLLLIAFLLRILIPKKQDYTLPINLYTSFIVLIFLVGVISYLRGVGTNPIEARRNLRAFMYFLSFLPLIAYCKDTKHITKLIKVWFYSIFVYLLMYYLVRIAPSTGSNA